MVEITIRVGSADAKINVIRAKYGAQIIGIACPGCGHEPYGKDETGAWQYQNEDYWHEVKPHDDFHGWRRCPKQ